MIDACLDSFWIVFWDTDVLRNRICNDKTDSGYIPCNLIRVVLDDLHGVLAIFFKNSSTIGYFDSHLA